MQNNLVLIKNYLGKYYSELFYASSLDKYKNTELENFFEQRFSIQNNKPQMIIDSDLDGLSIVVFGNEIAVSKELYDHQSIIVSNSMENPENFGNTKSHYNPETFSTVAYLICQNQTRFEIIGEFDEPIYIKYKSDFETFYNSVLHFNVHNGVNVEIVEEIESYCALNSVSNYTLNNNSQLNLSTFYKNTSSAISFVYRNIDLADHASYNSVVFGKGSSNIIDENRILLRKSSAELLGIRNSCGKNFHSIVYIDPRDSEFTTNVVYRDILYNRANMTFYPVILGTNNSNANIAVDHIQLLDTTISESKNEVNEFIKDIIDISVVERNENSQRFYNNKSNFLNFE